MKRQREDSCCLSQVLFELNFRLFGLSNDPAAFEMLMFVVLQGCNDFLNSIFRLHCDL